jgi:hypothetical protein
VPMAAVKAERDIRSRRVCIEGEAPELGQRSHWIPSDGFRRRHDPLFRRQLWRRAIFSTSAWSSLHGIGFQARGVTLRGIRLLLSLSIGTWSPALQPISGALAHSPHGVRNLSGQWISQPDTRSAAVLGYELKARSLKSTLNGLDIY